MLFILTVGICSNIAIAEDQSDKEASIKWKKSEQKLEQKGSESRYRVEHQVKRVLIYGRSTCETCDNVKDMLKKHNIEFQYIDLTWNRKGNMILSRKAGKEDVSYVFIGNQYIGNHEDLMSLLNNGQLFRMLEGRE